MELATIHRSGQPRLEPESREPEPDRTVAAQNFGNCVPVPGRVSSAAGPQRVIRRTLKKGTKAIASPADFLTILGRTTDWDPVEKKVIQFLCDATAPYKLRSNNWRGDLEAHMADMPPAFYATLATVADCDQVIAYYQNKKIDDSTGRLEKRRTHLFVTELKAAYDPGFGLDNPNLPTGYSPQVDKQFVGATLSSDRPSWQTGPNPYLGGGKTTGIQNIHISQQLVAQNLQKENDTKTGQVAVCVSCLRWVDINMMDTDHAQPLSEFKAKLVNLAEAMSADPDIYDDLDNAASKAGTKPTPVQKYFIVTGTGKKRTFRLNLEGLRAYSHNVDNLMKMCKACNQGAGKHFGGLNEWLIGNPYYGKSVADTFPSGPGTNRIVDRTTTGKGASQAIYSHLTDTYGDAVQATYPSFQFKEFTHKTITSTARKQFEADQTPPSTTRDERKSELDERGRRNETMVQSTKVLHQHFARKDRPKIRAGSPERDARALEQHLKTQDSQRVDKRKREDDQYEGFAKLAKTGTPTDTSTISDAKSKAVAELANRDAQQQFELDRAVGVTDAMAADLSLDQSLAIVGRSLGYVQGFTDTLQLRLNAAAAGRQHGLDDVALVLPTHPDPAVLIKLMTDYVGAYNQGKADAKMVT